MTKLREFIPLYTSSVTDSGVMLKIVATLPQLQLQILTMVVLEMRLYHQPLNMVSPLMFLDPNVRSVNSLKLLEETVVIDRPSLSSLVDLCLVLVVLLRQAVWQTPEETFLLKMRGGAIEKHVEIMLDLDSSNIQRILLWHQMLCRIPSSLEIRHLVGTPLLVLLTLHSRVLMYLRVYSQNVHPR